MEVEGETVGQYIGIKDKNDIDIYEGDIVYLPKVCNGQGDIATFKFIPPNYILKGMKSEYNIGFPADPSCYEIVGNIHEKS